MTALSRAMRLCIGVIKEESGSHRGEMTATWGNERTTSQLPRRSAQLSRPGRALPALQRLLQHITHGDDLRVGQVRAAEDDALRPTVGVEAVRFRLSPLIQLEDRPGLVNLRIQFSTLHCPNLHAIL